MQAKDIVDSVLSDQSRIATAISMGAAWEAWMRVELAILLRERGYSVAREVPYPPPRDEQTLDLLAGEESLQTAYAIELKVECAAHSGPAVLAAAREDMTKIQGYSLAGLGARWVVVIAYSATARDALREFGATAEHQAMFHEDGGVGVLVATR